MPERMSFFEKLKSRKIFHTLAIYASTSLTILGGTNLFLKEYRLPPQILDILLAFLLCGLPAALMFAWFHGGEQRRRLQKIEMAAYPVLFVIAVVIITRILGAPRVVKPSFDARSLAVLPFENLGDDKEDEYFSDGITDDIITHLSKIGDLKVISRTSIIQYKDTKKNIRQIGKELNVAAVLEGSVRRDKDRVRIISQLIDARGDTPIWAETFDRQITDIFAIQSEVAQRIATELKAKLSPDEKKRIEKKSTENIEAYAYYIKGREHYYRFTKEDNERAIELFEKAVELDPNYALAYAGLGDAYAQRHRSFDYPEEWLDTAAVMSRKAISLDPNLAEGYKALGLALESKGDIQEGLNAYYKAVELNPNYASVISNIGSVNYDFGKFDEGLKWARKAVVLQPGVARFYSLVALQYYNLGYDSLAVAWFKKALEFQPEFIFPHLVMTYIDLFAGKVSQAGQRIAKILASHPEDKNGLDAAGDIALIAGNFKEARQYFQRLVDKVTFEGQPGNKLAYVLLKLGERDNAIKILNDNLAACQKRPDIDNQGSAVRYYIAEIFSILKKNQEAVYSLEQAFNLGFYDRWISHDPLLENIQNWPEFKQLMEAQQKRIDAMRKRVRELGLDR